MRNINRYELQPTARMRRGLVILLIGLGPILLLESYFLTRHWVPIDITAPTTTMTVRTAPFTLNDNGRYTIEYRTEGKPPENLNCLLNFELDPPEPCPEPRLRIAGSWRLIHKGKIVAEEASDNWGWRSASRNTLTAEIGEFNYNGGRFPGEKYQLEVTIRNDLPQPAFRNPRLKVDIHPEVYVGYILLQYLIYLLGAAPICVGLYHLFAGLREYLQDKRLDRA